MGEEMTVEFQLASEAGHNYQISVQVLQFSVPLFFRLLADWNFRWWYDDDTTI